MLLVGLLLVEGCPLAAPHRLQTGVALWRRPRQLLCFRCHYPRRPAQYISVKPARSDATQRLMAVIIFDSVQSVVGTDYRQIGLLILNTEFACHLEWVACSDFIFTVFSFVCSKMREHTKLQVAKSDT